MDSESHIAAEQVEEPMVKGIVDLVKSTGFWGIVIALVTLGLGVYAQFFAKNVTELTLIPRAVTPLMQLAENNPKLTIQYDGKDIRYTEGVSLTIVSLRLTNTGNRLITREMFVGSSPCYFEFPQQEVLEVRVDQTTKPGLAEILKSGLRKENNRVYLPPLVMAAGDYFDINLVTKGPQQQVGKLEVGGVVETDDASIRVAPLEQRRTSETKWPGILFIAVISALLGYISSDFAYRLAGQLVARGERSRKERRLRRVQESVDRVFASNREVMEDLQRKTKK